VSGRRSRQGAGPELTAALLVPPGRGWPDAAVEAARAVAEEVLVVGAPLPPGLSLPEGVRAVPEAGREAGGPVAAALGGARGRWTLLVRPDELPHAPHPRTLRRYLRHGTASAFFVPFNDQPPLVRVLPTGAGRLWGDDPLPAQALLEAEPGRRLMATEGLSFARSARAWPMAATRPGGAWLRAARALAHGRWAAAARLLAGEEGPEAANLLGEAAFWRERWDEAEAHWLRALGAAGRPWAPAARAAGVGLGRLAEARGDLEGARAAYRRVLEAAPLDGAALARLLAVDWRLGASWPESVGQVVRAHPAAWRGIGRALDRVVPPAAQVRALRSMPMAYGRDLLLARAALAAGDAATARRSLRRVDPGAGLTAVGYQAWLTEVVAGSASEARAVAARCGDMSAAARLAMLLAAGALLGEPGQVPTLGPEETLEVGEWLLVVLADLALLRLEAQTRALARLVASLLGAAGAAEARAVLWRAARAAGAGRRGRRVRPSRHLVLLPRAARAPAWWEGKAMDAMEGVDRWPSR
jgi:tetratricopeptide (TPR) repeat protein